MAIIKWEPFNELDRFFDGFPSSSLGRMGFDMAVDLYEDGKDLVAEMSMPGIDPEKVEVSIEGNYLRVVGHREEEKEHKGKQFYSKEIQRGSFERAVRLPEEVESGAVSATYENGVLVVRMPKREGTKSGKIKVEVKK